MKLLKITFLWSSCFLMSLPVWASEGVLDTTFHSPDGYVLWDGGSGHDRGRDIALQQDGKILVSGYMTNGTDDDIMVIRYNKDGTLDAGFGTNGAYIYDGGNGDDGGYAIAVQSDNKILLAGESSNGSDGDVIVLRLDSDGSLDPNFGSNGIYTYDGGNGYDAIIDLLVQSDGSIVMCGSSSNETDNDLMVMRLNPSGAPDTAFGTNGATTYHGGNSHDFGSRLTIQNDGKILVTGGSDNGPDYDIVVVRFSANGTLDTSFGTNGAVLYDGGDYDRGYGIDTNSNGNILVTGVRNQPDQNSMNYDIPVISFDSNGNLDTSFGNNGIVLYDGNISEQCFDLIVQSDDTILVAGYSGNNVDGISDWSLVVLKYDPNGTLDTKFGTNGVYQYDLTDNTEWGYGLALQTDGKIVVAGQVHNGTDDDVIVLRLTNSPGNSNEPHEPNEPNEPNSPIDPNNNLPVIFADPNIENAVETALGVTDPTPADMLNLYQLDAMSLGVTDITGIEYATNLATLDLRFNQITDIHALSGLTNLWWLGLYSNLISDLSPVSGLTLTQALDLGYNQIRDISVLSGLTNLTYLDLTQNQISDVNALSGLTNLTRLYLYDNQITDVSPLSGLNSLVSLDLNRNQIIDINDFSALSALEGLWLNENQIVDISALTGLTNLTTLWLQQNPLNDNAYCTDLAVIYAHDSNMTLLYTPNPNGPEGLTASDDTYTDKVQVTWDALCNGPLYTSYYQVSRSDSPSGTKTAISAWQTTTTFTDPNVQPGTTCYYWVRAATDEQGQNFTAYSASDTGSVAGSIPDDPNGTPEPNDPNIPIEPNDIPPFLIWSRPPIDIEPNVDMPPVFFGWSEPARSTEQTGQKRQWRMDADDFRRIGPIPVTRIRWWGGYKAWTSPEPPESQPEAWHIGFWANQIEGIDQNETFPERMVWSLEIPAERIHFEPVGQLEFPQKQPDTCFLYEVQLEPEEWFHQVGYESNYDIFWISITAIYPADVEAKNLWSWITRPHLWGNGAVIPAIMGDWPTYDERLFPGRIYPIENSLLCGWNQAYDMCFELLTEHSWIKWDQPFTSLRDWPYSEDQVSFAIEHEDGNLQVERQVADDWLCERIDPVFAISWQGSYLGYGYEPYNCDQVEEPRRPDYFILSLQMPTIVPAQDENPSELVWEYLAYDYDEVLVGYDLYPESEPNESVFRYSVRLPEDAWFRQETPESIYWFSVVAVYRARLDEIQHPWGWANRPHMFGSPAISITRDNFVPEPIFDQASEPVDMSFTLFTAPQ